MTADSYFHPLAEKWDGGRYRAGPATEGPWDARLQHGGPPSALAVHVAERVIARETGRTGLCALRYAADFVGPVPVGEIETVARVVRAARSAALVDVIVTAAARECLHARVWFVRDADTASLAGEPTTPLARPDAPGGLDHPFGYGASIDWRFVFGRMGEPGPAAAWARPTIALLPGVEAAGLARVALVADSGSGISAELDWSTWSFVNVDLDLHLARPLEGEWVLMEAATQLGPRGSALARSTLSDDRGLLGSGLQTLVVAPMPTRQ